MKNAHFVLAGLVAGTILLGDCTQSEARGRLFGRRARTSCAPSSGASRAANGWVCPLYKTPYFAGTVNGTNYYMFYTGIYQGGSCQGTPQPSYLPENTPYGCNSAGCWDPNRGRPDRPPNLANDGHNMSRDELDDFGSTNEKYWIDIDPGAAVDRRKIDFHL